jgi:hypothetical protein
MQAERSNTPWTPRARRSQTQPQPRSRFSVTVAEEDAEPLRRALIDKLNRRIERLVIAPAVELGTLEPVAALHVVLDRDAVDEALHVVMSTASSAQLGRVRHH